MTVLPTYCLKLANISYTSTVLCKIGACSSSATPQWFLDLMSWLPIHSNSPLPGILNSLLINDYCHTFIHLKQTRNTTLESMFYTCTLLLLSTLPQIYSVPCQQIGKGNYDEPTGTQPQLDPFTAGQGFDIIQSQNCLLRFQNPDYNMLGSQSDLSQAIMACKSPVNYI